MSEPCIASQRGDLEIVRLLMTSTNNPNVPNILGCTPIHEAAIIGHLEIVQLLMTSTNNPNVPNKYGQTPETLASENGHHDIVELLKNA